MNFKRIFTLIFAFSFAWTINASAKTEIEWLQWFAAENTRDFYEGLVDEFEVANRNIS